MSGKKEKKSINLVGSGKTRKKSVAKAKRRGPKPAQQKKSRTRGRR